MTVAETMSFLQITSQDHPKIRERRGCPRETLKCVMLVFFGEDNWGKLIDISETGMSLEFAQPPPVRGRVNFSFQAMGCMPVPTAAEIFEKPFEATGEIIWTRAFERITGVRFVDLSEESREQIRQWMSFEAAGRSSVFSEQVQEEAPAPTEPPTEAPEPEVFQLETSQLDAPASEDSVEGREPVAEPVIEQESSLAVATFEAPAMDDERPASVEHEVREELTDRPNPARVRLLLVGVLGCLAVLGVAEGIRMIVPHWTGRAGAVGRIGDAATEERNALGAVASSSREALRPFQVEVWDASGKRWLLWFVRNSAANGSEGIAAKSGTSANPSAIPAKGASQSQAAPAEKSLGSRSFALGAPKSSSPERQAPAANHLSLEAPALPTELAAPLQQPISGVLASHAAPPPPSQAAIVGGEVQQARLIRSVPPIYPELAKSSRVSGDVVLDALIDASGNVTSVRVVSGPPLLQQAAVETLRQWKYQPARLDGKPVAMHLSVTLRFRLN